MLLFVLFAAIVFIIPPGCFSDGVELPDGVELEETETDTIISHRLHKIMYNFMFVFLAKRKEQME